MSTTLNEDEFSDDEPKVFPERYNILYGSAGYTDTLSDGTIDTLVRICAIRLHKAFTAGSFETKIYVSINGPTLK